MHAVTGQPVAHAGIVNVRVLRGDGWADVVGGGCEGWGPVQLRGVCCKVDFVAAGGEGGAELDDGSCSGWISKRSSRRQEEEEEEEEKGQYQRGCSLLQ